MKSKHMTIHFNCFDIAKVRGVTLAAVYKAIERKQLDVKDLRSIVKYLTIKKRRMS